MSQDMLAAALAYGERGWPIFPIHPGSKQPIEKGSFANAETRRDKITEWWTEHPDANIGMEPGGINCMVLDFDPEADRDAVQERSSTRLVAKTPRGYHEYFELHPDDPIITNSVSKVADHVDVRSTGGYVLLPPSRLARIEDKDGNEKHPGGLYEWEDDGEPAVRDMFILARAMATKRDKAENSQDWIIDPDLPENIAAARRWLDDPSQCQKVCISGTNGNDVAYETMAMMRSFGLSSEVGAQVFEESDWNQTKNQPPWSAGELLEGDDGKPGPAYTSYEYPTSPPGNMTNSYRVARGKMLFADADERREKGGRSGRVYGDGDDDDWGDTNEGNTDTSDQKYKSHTQTEMGEMREPPWLIPGVLPVGGYGILYGPPGSHKTFIALSLAMSVVMGGQQPWVKPEPRWAWPEMGGRGPVLFAAGEGRFGIRKRLQAWERVHGYDANAAGDDFVMMPTPDIIDNRFDWDDLIGWIAEARSRHRWYKLCVIDTVSQAISGMNENDAKDATQFGRAVKLITEHLGCAVLALHHTGHDIKATHARGSAAFMGGADIVMKMKAMGTKAKPVVEVSTAKPPKDAPDWDKPKYFGLVKCRFDPAGGDGEDNTSLAAIGADKPANADVQAAVAARTAGDGIDYDAVSHAVMEVLRKNPRSRTPLTAEFIATACHANQPDGPSIKTWQTHIGAVKKMDNPPECAKHFQAKYGKSRAGWYATGDVE